MINMLNGLIHLLSNIGLPQALVTQVIFYAVCLITAFFALRVVTSRNLFHSAILLAVTLMGIACIYVFLDAEFLAIVQILIYVGAIVTLFLFAIMLTAKIQDRSIRQGNQHVLLGMVVALSFFALFIKIIKKNPWQLASQNTVIFTLGDLGRSLMTKYALPFEVISIISLAALVGAIVIGKSEKK